VRKSLVIVQFAISIALIVATIIIQAQTRLLRGMDLGIDLDNRLVITGITSSEVAPLEDTIREQMLAIPGVTAAALASDELPMTHYNNSDFLVPELGVMDFIDTDKVFVDAHFFDLYGVQAVAGRLYGEEYTADTLVRSGSGDVPWTRNAVVTESFARAAGVNDPGDMLGKVIVAEDYGGDGIHLHATVIGVIADLHLRRLHEHTAQMVFFASNSVLEVMSLKIETGNLAATLAAIDDTWADIVPQVPIHRYFAQDSFDALYKTEQRRGQVLTALSAFAMFVACLGLFGLAAYSVEQKTLEIGIRKVHGARIPDILILIGAQLLKSVLWANLVAWPVVYFIMRDWLDSYAFRIDITPLVFITAGLLAAALALACVAWQVLKVARSSPIHALRYE
jgi:putative ABC transport system permease protein